jgi:Domain of Unknown Function (DUF928)
MRSSISRSFQLILSCFWVLTIVTAGGAAARYRPSKRQPTYRGPSTTTGTRGPCTSAGCLTAIAPLSHVGQSKSAQPTIAWFVPSQQTSCPGLLTMYRVQAGKRELLWTAAVQNQSGLNQWRLTTAQVLKPGEHIWQLVLECNPNRPSKNPVVEAGLGIIDSNIDTADLWYDQWRDAMGDRQKMQSLIQDLSALEVNVAKESVSQQDRLLKLKFD